MLKILQARLQQYVNHELPDVQAGFRKSRGTRDPAANICWIMEKAREFQKNIYFCFIDLGSIVMNKSSDGDGIPAKLFQILKDDTIKVLHSVCQQIWKTQQWSQDWKWSVSFQSQRRAVPKNVQTTVQLCSFHILAR